MMLAKFRHRYPQGSLVSELVKIDRGTYIVKALIQLEGIILATALAGGNTVEVAEDAAKERAIASLFLDDVAGSPTPKVAQVNPSSNHQIVNFSKPQSEPAATAPEALSIVTEPLKKQEPVKPAQPAPADPSSQQLDLEPVAANPDPEPSPNLFGDTFSAPNPTIEPPARDRVDSLSPPADSAELEAMDFNEIKQKTDIEIKRLGWTKEQGRDFLMSRYGKRSRLHLKDEQLIEFLHYLENLPNPVK